MSTIVESLTKDIVNRDLQAEGAALLNKWEKTGLLEGLNNERTKSGMARLLENQAKELLREASSMSAGDVEGFAAVAFPIVRRVFGGLIANELVSVQPMSLPSGLIFFLDFKFSSTTGLGGYEAENSVYGGQVVGAQVTGGVNLNGLNGAEKAPYGLQTGYSSPTGTINSAAGTTTGTTGNLSSGVVFGSLTDAEKARLDNDPDLLKNLEDNPTFKVMEKTYELSAFTGLNKRVLNSITAAEGQVTGSQVRRLTKIVTSGGTDFISLVVAGSATATIIEAEMTYVKEDTSENSGFANGALTLDLFKEGAGDGSSFTSTDLGGQNFAIPEIDIKVDSIAVTATTKKLKAKWTPELAQDLNAYHNLDAEVELTGILSEQVALEIDQEILNDLIQGATAGKKYWSRRPGKFVNRDTGVQVGATSAAPDFTGTVSEWYETLAETINDISANIHRKTLRGGANFVVCSPEVANLLEFTAGFRATVNHEELKGGQIGAVKVGAMSKKFDVYVDPYFPRTVILVGRRGNSFLESGYVYAPYVPLQVTPTIFGVEDFVPRKGVMTRYAKKMVRPDFYGKVVCSDLNLV